MAELRQIFDALQGIVGFHFSLYHVGANVIADPTPQPCWAGERCLWQTISRLVNLEVKPHCPSRVHNRFHRFLLPHGPLQPVGDPTHGDARNDDKHQQRYQAVSKPTVAGLGGVGHAGSIIAGLSGFKPGSVNAIMGDELRKLEYPLDVTVVVYQKK